jgi:hypothetical protein
MNRRSGHARRKFNDPVYKGPERRRERDRRSGKDRRIYRKVLETIYGPDEYVL